MVTLELPFGFVADVDVDDGFFIKMGVIIIIFGSVEECFPEASFFSLRFFLELFLEDSFLSDDLPFPLLLPLE